VDDLNMEDTFLTINNLRLHLRDWGGAGRSVILIHGLASNAKIWDWAAPELAKCCRVVALDQRSHGLSEAPKNSGYGFEFMCSDLHEVIAQLKLETPVLVGHSWGASVVLEFAARYPDVVRGVIMIDGGFLTLNKRMTWEEAEQRLAPPKLAGTPLEVFRERVKSFSGERFSDELFEHVLGNFEVSPDQTIRPHLAFESHLRIVRAMWEENAEELYPRVKCPALFLPCVPPEPLDDAAKQFLRARREGAELAAKLMPQAKVEWLNDSIHDVPLQKPKEVAERVRRFVEEN
jgi:pimeloyl-ACP methyl ester carboxylesterase